MTAGKIVSAIAMTEPDAGRYGINFTNTTDCSYFIFPFSSVLLASPLQWKWSSRNQNICEKGRIRLHTERIQDVHY